MERTIEASTTIGVVFARARNVLLSDLGAVFGAARTADEGSRNHCIQLAVDLRGGASVEQDATVLFAVPRSTEGRLVLPLAWCTVASQRPSPDFSGELEVAETGTGIALRLAGTYTLPLDMIERLDHRVVGWRLARRSLHRNLRRVAERLESEVECQACSTGRQPPVNALPGAEESSGTYVTWRHRRRRLAPAHAQLVTERRRGRHTEGSPVASPVVGLTPASDAEPGIASLKPVPGFARHRVAGSLSSACVGTPTLCRAQRRPRS